MILRAGRVATLSLPSPEPGGEMELPISLLADNSTPFSESIKSSHRILTRYPPAVEAARREGAAAPSEAAPGDRRPNRARTTKNR